MSSKSCLVYFCVSLKIQMAIGSILADFLGSQIDRFTFLISRSRCYLYIYFNSNAFFSPAAWPMIMSGFFSLSLFLGASPVDWLNAPGTQSGQPTILDQVSVPRPVYYYICTCRQCDYYNSTDNVVCLLDVFFSLSKLNFILSYI
jgi:hypothetical protein